MKILLANKFYYPRGGDCVYALNLQQMLEERGHKVAVFAMRHPDNLPSEWSGYFPSEISFSSLSGMITTAFRTLGLGEVRRRFAALLDDFAPDVVHLGNIHTQLSPVLACMAHQRGIKVVWTLHDYKLLCPRYDCLKNGSTPCAECFSSKFNVLRHKCMKNSLGASALAFAEALKWNRAVLEKNVDAFICPSRFMLERMTEGGFNPDKLHHICNSMDVKRCERTDWSREDYCCYVGRLSREKGVQTLVRAIEALPSLRLVVAGDGPMRGDLEAMGVANVEFVGKKDWPRIKEIVGKARFIVLPSECYENNPLSAIEALCLGTPVLGARTGGIPELITPGSGMTFDCGNVTDLRRCLEEMPQVAFDYRSIASQSRAKFSDENYCRQLLSVYC